LSLKILLLAHILIKWLFYWLVSWKP
jgi:hypothetical protein